MCSSLSFDKSRQLGNHRQPPQLRYGTIPLTATNSPPHTPFCRQPFTSSTLSPSGNHWSLYCPYGFAFSRMSCKWNHTVHCLLLLASFTRHSVFEFHPCGCISGSFLLLSLPLYGYATVVYPFPTWGFLSSCSLGQFKTFVNKGSLMFCLEFFIWVHSL